MAPTEDVQFKAPQNNCHLIVSEKLKQTLTYYKNQIIKSFAPIFVPGSLEKYSHIIRKYKMLGWKIKKLKFQLTKANEDSVINQAGTT